MEKKKERESESSFNKKIQRDYFSRLIQQVCYVRRYSVSHGLFCSSWLNWELQ